MMVLALAMTAKRREELCMLVLPRLLSLFRCYPADRRISGGKSVFGSTGAVAGIKGCAAITVKVDGLLRDVGSPKSDKESG